MDCVVMDMKNVCKSYCENGLKTDVLKNISLQIKKGEFVAITGSSGAGKSTLMNIMGCLDTIDSGCFRINGKNVSSMSEKCRAYIRNRDIGFVFQGFNLIPALTAEENVMLPLLYRKNITSAERKYLARQALSAVGLSNRIHYKPYELSGGQQQRVAIARAIASKPPIILADEPTGSLDKNSGELVLDSLLKLNMSGRTVIIVTHDRNIAVRANRQIIISSAQ